MSQADEKATSVASHVEDMVTRPDSIRDMSSEDLQKLETKMVRKMDLVIMCVFKHQLLIDVLAASSDLCF